MPADPSMLPGTGLGSAPCAITNVPPRLGAVHRDGGRRSVDVGALAARQGRGRGWRPSGRHRRGRRRGGGRGRRLKRLARQRDRNRPSRPVTTQWTKRTRITRFMRDATLPSTFLSPRRRQDVVAQQLDARDVGAQLREHELLEAVLAAMPATSWS